jgi:membrane protein
MPPTPQHPAPARKPPALRGPALRAVRWAGMVGHGFVADQCLLWASALAFTTALSLVPLLAVAFSISKGFGIQNSEFIRDLLMQVTAGREETVAAIIGYINNTNVRTLGTVGVGLLFATVISLLGSVEKSLNHIWGLKSQRTPWRKFSDYLTVILVCPLLILIAISATASLESSAVVRTLLEFSVLHTLWLGALKALPYVSTWLALLFVYTFIPNTRVRFGAAAAGAVLAGSLWQAVQWGYITYQASFRNYNAIYGSFAQVPLLLIWLFVSWAIVLLGAQISFAVQNSGTYQREATQDAYSHDDRQKLAALALALLTRVFMDGGPRLGNAELARLLDAPVRLVGDVMHMLARAGIVLPVAGPRTEGAAYTLARPPDSVRMLDVIQALSRFRQGDGPRALGPRLRALDPVFAGLLGAAKDSPHNMTLARFARHCAEQGTCPDPYPADDDAPGDAEKTKDAETPHA